MKHFRSQSAMEYLMTYGWAILIVAVVILALYELGVFGGQSLAPKVPPGACEIYRNPAVGVQLAGQCNNGPPETVLKLDGSTGYVDIGSSPTLDISGPVSITAWIRTTNSGTQVIFSSLNNVNPYPGYVLATGYPTADGAPTFCTGGFGGSGCEEAPATANVATGAWTYVAVTNDGTNTAIYVNGKQVLTATENGPIPHTAEVYIGQFLSAYYYSGYVANIQVYNTSLNSAEVQGLYLEGIGGVPDDPAHIIGWWPLNSNLQDYSGNNNNGEPAGSMSYTGLWYQGYTPP